MPRKRRAGSAGADAACLAVLSRLAAKGAYAAPVDDASGSFGIFMPGGQPIAAHTLIAADAVALLIGKKWIAADEQHPGCYRISAGGINELRRARSAPASTA